MVFYCEFIHFLDIFSRLSCTREHHNQMLKKHWSSFPFNWGWCSNNSCLPSIHSSSIVSQSMECCEVDFVRMASLLFQDSRFSRKAESFTKKRYAKWNSKCMRKKISERVWIAVKWINCLEYCKSVNPSVESFHHLFRIPFFFFWELPMCEIELRWTWAMNSDKLIWITDCMNEHAGYKFLYWFYDWAEPLWDTATPTQVNIEKQMQMWTYLKEL